ncbi:hypothetical protein ACVWY0_000902 [Arthrobacter sp. UYNi723]
MPSTPHVCRRRTACPEPSTAPRQSVPGTPAATAGKALAEASPEAAEAGMKMWMDWAAKAGDGIVDLGTPLGATNVLDGSSVADTAATVGGYSLIQAEDLDAAISRGCRAQGSNMPGRRLPQ